jgi:hypothetical protein
MVAFVIIPLLSRLLGRTRQALSDQTQRHTLIEQNREWICVQFLARALEISGSSQPVKNFLVAENPSTGLYA